MDRERAKRETLRHREAFEFYYTSGPERTYRKVAKKFGVSLSTIRNWGRDFNWQKRVDQRDLENARELEKRTNTQVVDIKAQYRKDIETQNRIIKAMIGQIAQKLQRGDLEAKTMGDFRTLVTLFKQLVELDQLLIGEPTERSEINDWVSIVKKAIDSR